MSDTGAPSHVLVLDDEPFMLHLLSHMLGQLGDHRVSCRDNGAEALALLDEDPQTPGLILLDINMPGMDGVEFVRHLSGRRYGGAVVLVSGEDELLLLATERLARAHGLRMLASLRKPPTAAGLRAALAGWPEQPAERRRPNRATYDPAAVRSAVEQGQLVNYYQPQVDLASGRMVGVETLVRWQHPNDGLVFPDQFVGVAEAHGLIYPLTCAVIGQAFAQARRWRDAGIELRLSVNVTMDDLSTLQFADFVIAEAAAHGLPAQTVELEVTESRLMHNLTAALDVLTRLRLKRFGLSIDDFGSGHSSLVQLRDLPFDELKIDRSFTHNASHDARLRAILEGSLGIGRQLGMLVVAEGVEDFDDWVFLRRTRCPVAQGYFIARPMPAAALPAWMHEWEARIWQDRLLEGDDAAANGAAI